MLHALPLLPVCTRLSLCGATGPFRPAAGRLCLQGGAPSICLGLQRSACSPSCVCEQPLGAAVRQPAVEERLGSGLARRAQKGQAGGGWAGGRGSVSQLWQQRGCGGSLWRGLAGSNSLHYKVVGCRSDLSPPFSSTSGAGERQRQPQGPLPAGAGKCSPPLLVARRSCCAALLSYRASCHRTSPSPGQSSGR